VENDNRFGRNLGAPHDVTGSWAQQEPTDLDAQPTGVGLHAV